MGDAMAASGTIVRLVFEVALAFVLGIEQLGLGVHDLIWVGGFWFFQDDVVFGHVQILAFRSAFRLAAFGDSAFPGAGSREPEAIHTAAGTCSSIFANNSSTDGTLPPTRP